MVRFDVGGGAIHGAATLDDIGIQRALGQEMSAFNVASLVLEHVDENVADAAAFFLWIADALQRLEKTRSGIDDVQVRLKMASEGALDRLDFPLSQQAIIDENARYLPADGAEQQGCRHRGIDAAGQTADDTLVANALNEAGYSLR